MRVLRKLGLLAGHSARGSFFPAAWTRRVLGAGLVSLVMLHTPAVWAAGPKPSVADQLNDYPTEARADYVFGCMATNGQSSDVLRRCSCSIDVIASILPYDKYVEAATVLSMRQTGGERMAIFSQAASAKELVANLRRAQAEADIVCF